MDLAGADDIKAQRRRLFLFEPREHVDHVVGGKRFPLMQADQDVARLDSRLGRRTLTFYFQNYDSAAQLAGGFAHFVRRGFTQSESEPSPDNIIGLFIPLGRAESEQNLFRSAAAFDLDRHLVERGPIEQRSLDIVGEREGSIANPKHEVAAP